MKKIICLCTIVLMMMGLFACDTEQSGSGEGETTDVKSGVSNGTLITFTLDNQGANSAGTKQIFLKYNVGFYLDKNGKKEITDESGAITVPVKTGCAFAGYNTAKDGKGQDVITANGLLDLGVGYTDFKADTTLYAQWTVDTTTTTVISGTVIKLTLDNQDAKTKGTEQIYLKYNDGYYFERSCGTKIGLNVNPIECPTKIGCVFRGYNSKQDGSGQNVLTESGYLDVDAGFTDFNADTTLYAVWEVIPVYEIKYYETKGAMNTNVKTFTESDNVTLNKNITAEGYTFLGWFDASTDGREITGWTAGQKTADVSLWAYWQAKTYTVDLTNDGNTTGTKSVTATFNANLPDITIPTKTGFQFAGYYTDANGVGTKYIDKDGKSCHIWDIADNVTLYADWIENEGHSITYIGADDIDNSANPNTFKESQSITIQNISKTGYEFGGWWTAENGGIRVSNWQAGEKTTDITLYARWTAKSYTVTLTSNGTTTGTKSVTATFGETVPDIIIPTKNGSEFLGYYAGENGIGTKYIDGEGKGCHIWDIADNATIYADWQEKTHSITYIGADDCDNSDNPTTFKESEAVTIQNISKDGYIFGGWWTEETEGSRVSNWAALSKTDDVTLYARWTAITYTVTYYANGGSGSMLPQSFTYDEAQNLTSCGFTAPIGMKFSMWNTQADGLGVPYTDGQSVSNLTTTNNATVQLFAQWVDKATHSITYNNIKTADNGLNPLTFGESQNITLQDLSLPGWDFNGWWTAENGGSKVTGWNAGTKTDDVTLYARWTIQTYTITYKDQNGNNFSGVHGTDYPQQHTYGTTTSLVIPSKVGYDFEGWHLQSDCLDNSIDTIGAEMITANTPLYAKWNIIQYNIIYNNVLNGINTNQIKFTIENNVTLSNIVRTGYKFDGWWTESEGGSQVTGWNAGAKTEDVTVYARWTANSYTIVFSANGGTGTMNNMSMTYDVSANLTANTFTLSGHNWLGWSTNPNAIFESEYTNEQEVVNLTADQGATVNLYAVWNTRVGDIAYSDGTFSSAYNADKTPIGVVCYTNTKGTSGKIAHLSEQSSLAWCLRTADGFKYTIATNTSDGSNNWQIICDDDNVNDENIAGNYPAFEYVNSLGDGWYMPAKDELNQIYINKDIINATLIALRSCSLTVTTLSTTSQYTSFYWSSSAINSHDSHRNAWKQDFYYDGEGQYGSSRDNSYHVRAIRAF